MLQHFKIKFLLFILLLTLLNLTACSLGRSIDQRNDYSSELKDGQYSAESRYYNTFGFKESLTFWINKGIITKVEFTEVNQNKQNRLNLEGNYQHWPGCELNYPQIIDQLYKDSILSQGDSIDTITGATKTVTDYTALQKALMKAITTQYSGPVIIDQFSDSYIARNEIDPVSGSQEEIEVTIKNGQVTSVNIKEVTNNTAFYAIGRIYESLADFSERTHSLEPIENTNIDPVILERYNRLLEQIRNLRGL